MKHPPALLCLPRALLSSGREPWMKQHLPQDTAWKGVGDHGARRWSGFTGHSVTLRAQNTAVFTLRAWEQDQETFTQP